MDGNIFKKLRQEKGLTQKEISNKLGLTQAMISSIEKNKKGVSNEVELNIANFFNVTIEYLRGLTVERQHITIEGKVDMLLKHLVDNGIISDADNIDEDTQDLIMAMIRKEIKAIKEGK